MDVAFFLFREHDAKFSMDIYIGTVHHEAALGLDFMGAVWLTLIEYHVV